MKVTLKKVKKKNTVLNELNALDVPVNSPCGGKHKCGKCLIKILSDIAPPSKEEKKLLGKNFDKGYRLACFLEAKEGMEIEVDSKKTKSKIMISSEFELTSLKPELKVYQEKFDRPTLHNQVPDIDIITEKFNRNDLHLVTSISKCLHKSDYNPTLIKLNKEIVGVCAKSYKTYYGISIDIGTTTIASYLYDLKTGKRLDVVSNLNNQKKYGADVISRIEYSYTAENGLKNLNSTIINQINTMVTQLCERNSITCHEIFYITIVGNTTMMHLVMNLDPENIGRAPFIPITTSLHRVKASTLGIKINQYGFLALLPSVASYVGSDITAGVIATNMANKKEISLLLDIGTNGEIVLGNKQRLISCSTAAGPAFEGANIRFGTGGISGAIDAFKITDNEVVFTTIDNYPPIGICGSGIVTILAALLKANIVDETGRFFDEDELEISDQLKERIVEFENMTAFKITDEIFITQKDIREIQNAKASFAAGVITLVKRYGITFNDIDYLYLAGGFGNYIDVQGAIEIGLFPKELRKKVIPSGNTAGTGAAMCLLSSSKMKKIEKISKEIEYIELSSDPSFTDQYIECMMFE